MKKLFFAFAFLLGGLSAMAKPDPIDIQFGPWVTKVTETSFTVLWTTKTDNLGWIEVTDDMYKSWKKCDVKSFYQTFAGRWEFGKLHCVTVTGLEKGKQYRYRVCGKKVVDDSLEQDLVFGIDKCTAAFSIKTFDGSKQDCHFSMVNDIHCNTDAFSSLMSQVNADSTDFVLLNGDIATAGNYETDSLIFYEVKPIGKLLKKVPVMYSRGNHEGRGNNWQALNKIFPTVTPGQFYYTFRQGPVAFLVLDAGETKPAVAKSYVGTPAYEKYLAEELEWARSAVKSSEFADAPVKICIIHVPMTGASDALDYNTQSWMKDNFIPFLNDAGIKLMLNAHTHKYRVIEAGETYGNQFPMIINGRCDRMQVDVDARKIHINVFNTSGEKVHAYDVAL